MKQTTNDMRAALAAHLGCEADELKLLEWESYGMPVWQFGSDEWAVGTDEQADEACETCVRDSLWAFRAEFLLSVCGLPSELAPAIGRFCSDHCEDANDAMLALVEKTCGLKRFTELAVQADGRGHFLSSYDGEEIELGNGLFAYRIN